jgi:peptidoglycan-associated lipoprotein
MIKGKFLAAILVASLAVACSSDDETVGVDGNGAAGTGANAGQNGMSSARAGTLADFQQNVGDKVYFGYDEYVLTEEAKQTLARQAQWLKQYAAGKEITIEGHADERGTREYNFALGARRANSVKNFLASQGVTMLKVISYGKERPAVEGSNEEAWAQNRRGVTTISGIESF